jgi:hypothetical protein
MANIARPPCDEAAILAGSCERPAITNGPWILATTILGFVLFARTAQPLELVVNKISKDHRTDTV